MIKNLPSRAELMNWVKDLTKVHIQKLQQLSDGVQFCQIFNMIYPKTINLAKLKRDAKVPMEKERNFRLLLNAINVLQLNLTINIMDLSESKVTSILELLQWIHKEFKNPTRKFERNENKMLPVSEFRVIKSYVGNLYTRQKSCQKQDQRSQSSENIRMSRKSLDLHNLQNQNSDIQELIKQKRENSQKIVVKESPQSNKKSSRVSMSFKIIPKNKDSQNSSKGSMKLKKISNDQSFQEVLHQALNLDRSRLKNTLIKVTETAADGNPQLQQKLKRILQSEIQTSDDQGGYKNLSPDSQVRNILSSYARTSERCQKDSVCPGSQIQITSVLEEHTENEKQQHSEKEKEIIGERQNRLMISNTKKQNSEDRKQTVKKGSVKSGKDKNIVPRVLSNHIIKQITAQKQKKQLNVQEENNQNKDFSNGQKMPLKNLSKNQDGSENTFFVQKKQRTITEMKVQPSPLNANRQREDEVVKSNCSNVFNPHQKIFNPEKTFTYTQIDQKQVIQVVDARRNAFSQNLSLKGQANKNQVNIWDKNANLIKQKKDQL